MKILQNTFLLFISVSILGLTGCGSDRSSETASYLSEDDIEVLANYDNPESGSAQSMVEVIPVPAPIAPPDPIDVDIPIVEPTATREIVEQKVNDATEGTVQQTTKVQATTTEQPTGVIPFTEKVQISLREAGYYGGSIDGIVGPETRKAIMNFQSEQGLKSDGLVGPSTWDKLKTYYNQAGESSE